MKRDESDLRNNEVLQDEIKGAVETGRDIKETVRRITLKALTEGELDTKSVRQVASAVVKGAGLGAASHGPEAKVILAKAVSGLDEALSKAAEASKLALEEAAGRGEEFSSRDLKRTLDDMQGLEELFLETLRDAAKGGKDQVSATLHDLAEHAQHSGTAVGTQLKEGLTDLVEQVTGAGKTRLESGTEAAKTTGSLLARLASGMLEGIADSLHPPADVEAKPDEKSPHKTD